MKALLTILICLGVVLAVLAFFTDVRIPIHTHTTSVQSDGTTAGIHITSSQDEMSQFSLRPAARIGFALDVVGIIVVAVLL
jgi:hypothetical protein